jgi:hypothetical protein
VAQADARHRAPRPRAARWRGLRHLRKRSAGEPALCRCPPRRARLRDAEV